MKKLILNQKIVWALIGVLLAFNIVWNANAQQLGLLAAKQGMEEHLTINSENGKDEAKEEQLMEEINIEIEDVPTVTFINKYGELVAVLYGDNIVLKEIYAENLSKNYHLSSYRNHEIYLIK